MVVQKTISNLKERPKDERKAVAGGIAIFIVVVLLLAWGFLFIRRIQNGTQQITIDSGAQSEFNFQNVKAAQQAIEKSQDAQTIELYQIRDDNAAQQIGAGQSVYIQEVGQGTDAFGNPTAY